MVTVTISGTPGSGKSTVAQLLEKHLGIPYVYSGMIFRTLAHKHNMSLEDFGKYCETHEEIDRELDDEQLRILKKGNVIVEGRLAGWLVYNYKVPAFTVFIDADIDVRAARIAKREKGTIAQRKQEMLAREESEALRYKTYYDIDLNDNSIYDLVIDSSKMSAEEITTSVLNHIKK